MAGKGPKTWDLPTDLLEDLVRLYPSVDVPHEVEKAAAKIRVGAVSKKTARGMPRFLHAWMGREQNGARAPRANGTSPAVPEDPPKPSRSAEEILDPPPWVADVVGRIRLREPWTDEELAAVKRWEAGEDLGPPTAVVTVEAEKAGE